MASLKLAPCVDDHPHKFVHTDGPPPGMFGYVIIYCQRCGGTRTELLIQELVDSKEN